MPMLEAPFPRLAPLLFCVCASTAHAQTTLDWTRMRATTGHDQATCVTVDAAGNVYAAGSSSPTVFPMTGSAFVAAWDAAGNPLWTTTFDATPGGSELPSAIAHDGAGFLYVVGVAHNPTQSQARPFLWRLDVSGSSQWSVEQPVMGAPAFVPCLLVDAQGRAIVGGRAPLNQGDLSIAAYSTGGALAWQATHNGTAGLVDMILDLALAPNGNIVGAGVTGLAAMGPSSPLPAVFEVTPAGAIVRAIEHASASYVWGGAGSIAIGPNGDMYLAASSATAGAVVPDLATIALDAAGNESWVRLITGHQQPFGGGAGPIDIALDAFGRVLVLGERAAGGTGDEALLAAYGTDGTLQWLRAVLDPSGIVVGGHLWSKAQSLVLLPNGESVVIGYAGPAISDTVQDAFAFGVDATGALRFSFLHGFPPMPDGTSYDRGLAGAGTPSGGFVIVGHAQTAQGNLGFDAFVSSFGRSASGYCFGDGSGNACPCGNASAPAEQAGCASSFGVGARLVDQGVSSLANDTLVLVGASMPNSSALFFQGTTALAGAPLGDGLRCTGGAIVRLGVKTLVGGTAQYPSAGDLAVSVRGNVAAPGVRSYQVWYRNAAVFCTSDPFNLSNGMSVTWSP